MCSQAIDSMIRNGNVSAETGNIFISETNTGSKLQVTNLLINSRLQHSLQWIMRV